MSEPHDEETFDPDEPDEPDDEARTGEQQAATNRENDPPA